MNRELTVGAIAASCLLGSSLGSAAAPLKGELQSAAVVEAVTSLWVDLLPDMAEFYGEIITHWWEQNGAVREALHELASQSATPEGLEQQIAFEELIPTALIADCYGPLTMGDRVETVRHGHERVPSLATGRDDGVVVGPDTQA